MTKIGFLILVMMSSAFGQTQEPRLISKEEVAKVLKDTWEARKNATPTKEAEEYYQYQTDDRPCTHCPEYLKLIREVNRVVEKVPAKNNESLVQLNRLKFLYYEVKSANESGDTKCVQYQHYDVLNPKRVQADDTTLLAEEALSLPNVTSLQYIPQGDQKEIRYFYRGEGSQRNMLIEIVIYPDRRAVIRYHKSTADTMSYNLPDLGGSAAPQAPSGKGISEEVKLTPGTGKIEVAEGIQLNADAKAKLNRQTVGVSLNDGTKDWVKVELRHKTLKEVEVSTVLPVDMKLTDDGLSVGGAVTMENTKEFSGATSNKKAVELRLTDHNNEYLKTSIVSHNDVEQIVLSSRLSLGSYGTVSGVASTNSQGQKETSISHAYSDDRSSITTKIGMSPDARKYFELQREQKIDKHQTLVLTVKTDSRHETTVMYQYRLTLKP